MLSRGISVFKACITTTRPLSSLLVGALAASAAMGGRSGITLRGVAAGATITALAMFGFCSNDIADFDKDRAAGVRRPIAMGELTRVSAVRLAIAVLACAGLLAAATGTGVSVLVAVAAGLIVYSPAAHRFPLGKDVFVAALCCGALYYGAVAGGRQLSSLSYALLVCFVLGREVLMDSEEAEGDSRAGMRTLAVRLGRRRAARLGAGLMLGAAAVLAATARGPVVMPAAAATLTSLLWVLEWPGLNGVRRVEWSRFPMLLGTVALAWGSA